ncbi:MAG: MerR family transcriptional regulator [Myxococcales bacterium]|nr:MerR family transcriptional regulator [Myxococcales bacterium]
MVPETSGEPRSDSPGRVHDQALTTGDMARETGSTLRTVRFYEEAGLIHAEGRANNGCRRFSADQLGLLQLALGLREAGLSLDDIRHLFELKRRHACAEAASREMIGIIEDHVGAMDRKIARLQQLRDDLTDVADAIQTCLTCDEARFPAPCRRCEVMNESRLRRTLRALWSD